MMYCKGMTPGLILETLYLLWNTELKHIYILQVPDDMCCKCEKTDIYMYHEVWLDSPTSLLA